MKDVPRFCEVCGLRLRVSTSPAGFSWMECPRWPKRGPHWWSEPSAQEHSRFHIADEDRPRNFDRMTGERIR